MDIDTAIRKTNLSLENVIKMITEIINIDVDDKDVYKRQDLDIDTLNTLSKES